ncbi:ABC transporter permease subunit [Curvivirga aplysinae]|uniref:ABC transporter permease subunit n=1 Tax=Curvivirga aplysinae TaxID=2529852 RepID=UPI0012BB637F|nr:ABC transporter permease subunit [Curvivirga aplysinae]MTI10864.1 ABC transporter permease subunit [Curvivirga aplysinae]
MSDNAISNESSIQERSTLSWLDDKLQQSWKFLLLLIPYAWLLIFFLAPFILVLKVSMAEPAYARPPYTPLWEWAEDGYLTITLIFENFSYLWEDELYYETYLNSVVIAFNSTIMCLLIGYPIAYGIVRSSTSVRNILLLLIILPFWTSFLLRVYAWMGILGQGGELNDILIFLGILDEPHQFLYTQFAVYVGIVYSYLPFMILPLYASLEKLDMTLNEAAADLGAKPITTFLTVTLPLSIPGIVAGSMLVFIPATGEYVIPDLLGGGNVAMIGRQLFNEFGANKDWPVASAVAIALLILLVVPMMIYQHYQAKETEAA